MRSPVASGLGQRCLRSGDRSLPKNFMRHRGKCADTREGVVPGAADGRVVGEAGRLSKFRSARLRVEDHIVGRHARQRDFARWIGYVFSDGELASPLGKVQAGWGRGEVAGFQDAIT